MYGLEKKQNALFEFDLEKELKKDETKKNQLLKEVEEKTFEIKNIIRKGTSSKDFDNFGILLHGYVALQKVIKKINSKKP